jgi:hypothetical protein
VKLKAHGKIWDVDYISATNKDGRVWNFFSNYELIPDKPTATSTSTLLNQHDAILLDHAGCIGSLQEECAKAKSWINTLISDNQRLNDRLNKIEGLGIQR